MSDLLFEENNVKIKHNKFFIWSSLCGVAALLALAVYFALRGDLILSLLYGVVCVAAVGGYLLGFLLANRYLLVYTDKIICKKAFLKEKTIPLCPSDYKIRIIPKPSRTLASVKLVFVDRKGAALLKYNSSIMVNTYREFRQAWKYDIFSIGCPVIDETWEIK